MATFTDYWRELIGYVPDLPSPLAKSIIHRAWREIRDTRRWSFLRSNTIISIPDVVSAGTVTVTKGSTTVTPDATALAAWNAAPAYPPLTDRQFRLPGGPIYEISTFAAGVITLSRAYAEATAASATYEIYRVYIWTGPDFSRWISITDPVSGFRFARQNLLRSCEDIDRQDAQRTDRGDAYLVAAYRKDATRGAMYELWPHQTSARSLEVRWQSRGVDLAADGSLPVEIPDDLLMDKARHHAYQWAATQPKLVAIPWGQLMREVQASYRELLQQTKVRDEEAFLQNHSDDEPPDSEQRDDPAWMQTHP